MKIRKCQIQLSRLIKRNSNFKIFDLKLTSSLDTKTGLSPLSLSERFGVDVYTDKSVVTGALLMGTKTVSVRMIIILFDGCWIK